MSCSNQINIQIFNKVQLFIDLISKQYKINKKILESFQHIQNIPISTYHTLSKFDLLCICKQKNILLTGSKMDLINRLIIPFGNTDTTKNVHILQRLQAQKPTISIKRNKFNNFEHIETNFIFDSATEKVIGKQHTNGNILLLNGDDIELCNQYKFQYVIPHNLDNESVINPIIEGIDDDIDDQIIQENDEYVDDDYGNDSDN